MKSVLFLMVTLLCGQKYTFAQFQKGNKLIGGGFSISQNVSQQSLTLKSSSLSLQIFPQAGWFIADHTEIGVMPTYTYQKSDWHNTASNYSSEQASNRWGGNFYLHRYFTINEKLYFSLLAAAGYQKSIEKEKSNYNGTTTDDNSRELNTLNAMIRPQFTYFVTPHWALRGSFSELSGSLTINPINNYKNNSVGARWQGLGLGLIYIIR